MQNGIPSWVQNILASPDDVVYLLDGGLHIEACNPGWDEFASANCGEGVSRADVCGRYIFDFIPDVLVTFYERKHSEALQSASWTGFDYACSTPELFRLFHMSMHPVDGSGLLIVNSYLADQRSPLPAEDLSVPESAYRSPAGVVTMCAHCRRTRREAQSRIWDWVPQFVRNPGKTISHGLCPACVRFFYPDEAPQPKPAQTL
jgi:hypothetical protein